MNSPFAGLSGSEIEKIREALIQHDRSAKPFDINNPPPANYRHQEYPRLVYKTQRDGKQVNKAVHSDEELDVALKAGFSKQPPVAVKTEEDELNEDLKAEVEQVETELAEARAKRAKKAVTN